MEHSADFADAGSLWFCVWRLDLSVVAEIVRCRSRLWWECWGGPGQATAETGRGVAGSAERGRADPGRPEPGRANPGWIRTELGLAELGCGGSFLMHFLYKSYERIRNT